jgi:hypothetical protein
MNVGLGGRLRIVYENESQHINECGLGGLRGKTLRIVYENESQHRNECGLRGRTLRIVYEMTVNTEMNVEMNVGLWGVL